MTSLLLAARRPDLWPAALAAFLLRGGIALVALPILVLPSTVGVATFFGPTSVTPAGPSPSLVAFGAAVGGVLLAWGLLGGLAAAAAETVLIRRSIGSDAGEPSLRVCARILVARAVTSFPILLAVAWAGPRIGAAAYAQLTHPSDPSVAFVVRVLGDAPDALVGLVGGWLLANALGALAARRIVLFGDGAFAAAWRALRQLVARPVGSLASVVAGAGLFAAALGLGLGVARDLWGGAARALDAGSGPVGLLFVAAFVAAWSAALLAAALLASWRGIAWTFAALTPADAGGRPALDGVGVPGGPIPEPVVVEA